MKPEHRKFIVENYPSMTAQQLAARLGLKERTIKRLLITLKDKNKAETGASAAAPRVNRDKPSWIIMGIIVMLGMTVYWNTLKGEFIWDDNILVINNVEIKNWNNLDEVLFGNLGGTRLYYEHSSYRPVQTLTYMLDYHFWKLKPKGYHITNMVFHILTGLSVYGFILMLFGQNILAAATAMIFIVHPIHTEAVSYISGRADPMSAFFIFVAMIYYLKLLEKETLLSYTGMFLAFLLAIFSRENSLMFSLNILFYHFAFRRKINWKALGGVVALSVLYVVLRKMEILGAMKLMEPERTTILERIPGFLLALTKYSAMMFWPANLHMEYGRALYPLSHPQAVMGLLIFLGLMASIVFTFSKRYALFCFGLVWFIGGLAPVSNVFVVVNAFMAEHWLYLPSMGIFLLVAFGLAKMYAQAKLKIAAIVIFGGIVGCLSILTVKQNETWLKPIPFYERTLKFAPLSARLNSDLGAAYYNEGRKEDAIRVIEEAVRLKPNYYAAFSNLGTAYLSVGQREKAISALKKAIEIRPDFSTSHFNLGNVYKDMGRIDEAIKEYELVIRLDPGHSSVYNNLAIAYSEVNQKEKAITMYLKAIEVDSANSKFYNNIASTYSDLGKHKEAITYYRKAIETESDVGYRAIFLYNLALSYFRIGDNDMFLANYQQASAIEIPDPAIYDRFADIFQQSGLPNQAQEMALRAKMLRGQR